MQHLWKFLGIECWWAGLQRKLASLLLRPKHTLGQRNLNVSENLANAKLKFETSLFWRPKVIEAMEILILILSKGSYHTKLLSNCVREMSVFVTTNRIWEVENTKASNFFAIFWQVLIDPKIRHTVTKHIPFWGQLYKIHLEISSGNGVCIVFPIPPAKYS